MDRSDDDSEHEVGDDWLLFVYAAAALLLVVYFVCERGPCHWSKGLESVYLAVLLLGVWFTSMVWSELGTEVRDPPTTTRLRSLMKLFLISHIFHKFVSVQSTPKFFDSLSARADAEPKGRPPPKRAERIAQELDEAVAEILEWSSGRRYLSTAADAALEPALFVLFMLEDIVIAFEGLSEILALPLLACNVLIPVWGIIWWAMKSKRLSELTDQVHLLVVDMVRKREKRVLRAVIKEINVGTLVEVAAWKTVLELTSTALSHQMLCTTCKAILIDALQMRGVRLRGQREVMQIIRSCKGAELTALKNLVDGSGSYQNLYKLIYHDISNRQFRQDILKHLAEQAHELRQELGRAAGVKILSDVDDTLYCSGGKFPAGCDKRFPRGVVYPGFLRLLRILDSGYGNDAPCCNVVFLSARPHIYKDVAEDHTYDLFRRLRGEGQIHTFPTLLPGRIGEGLWALLCFACQRKLAWRPVGEFKYQTFLKFRRLYREYDFIFCGDNGQGDLLVGQHMLSAQRGRAALYKRPSEGDPAEGDVISVLIHRVAPVDGMLLVPCDSAPPPIVPSAVLGRRWNYRCRQRIVLHKSYVGAALALHWMDPGLVALVEVAAVAEAAMDDFDTMRRMYSDWGDGWKVAEQDLREDIDAAAQLVLRGGLRPLRKFHTLEELVRADEREEEDLAEQEERELVDRTAGYANILRRGRAHSAMSAVSSAFAPIRDGPDVRRPSYHQAAIAEEDHEDGLETQRMQRLEVLSGPKTPPANLSCGALCRWLREVLLAAGLCEKSRRKRLPSRRGTPAASRAISAGDDWVSPNCNHPHETPW